MTRKDYELIAYAVKLSRPDGRSALTNSHVRARASQHRDTVECIADAFTGDNPRFDRARFMAACGLEATT